MEGLVQGVGFRPFVYSLALKHTLFGFVLNTPEGVCIDVEGSDEALVSFEHSLCTQLPPLARIDLIFKEARPVCGYTVFSIRESQQSGSKHSAVPPDMGLCEACLKEMNDPSNFRYKYPFINCTNCGPRYSIIQTVPYDRPHTSMAPFTMCPTCKSEYDDPLNRRYHAQPVSCAQCGPSLFLRKIDGTLLAKDEDAIKLLVAALKEGSIVAMKGMGGFHLMCNGENEAVVQELRKRKHRPTKPFAVLCKNLEQAALHVSMTDAEIKMLTSIVKPIVLMQKKQTSTLAVSLAPGIDRLGIFLPYTPLHVRIFDRIDFALIATSANRSGEPIIKDSEQLQKKMSDVIDLYLDYDRTIINASDDSVVQLIDDSPLLMRSSRGLTPHSFRIETKSNETILAVGAQQKNAIAVYKEGQIIQSPYIGDMDNLETFAFFERTIETFKSFYNLRFDRIITDKHPSYMTTKWAKAQNVPIHQVQHHFAHIVATMFEHGLHEEVLGVAWDGTGYGDDGTIWGGEFFLCTTTSYERVGHFAPFKLLGGDASIKQIKRIAFSLLQEIPKEQWTTRALNFMESFPLSESKLLTKMYEKNLNSPLCSSVGRLFDAVAAIATGLEHVSYDGESGLIIEGLYDEKIQGSYQFECDAMGVIWHNSAILSMFQDSPSEIATKFLNGLVNCIIDMAKKYQRPVVLGGGVFQNKTLVKSLRHGLIKENIPLFFPHKTVSNDGSVALGQLATYILAQ